MFVSHVEIPSPFINLHYLVHESRAPFIPSVDTDPRIARSDHPHSPIQLGLVSIETYAAMYPPPRTCNRMYGHVGVEEVVGRYSSL